MADALVRNIDYQSFDTEVLETPGYVLVDFWADWCEPCKALAPIIDHLAAEFQNKIKVCKCDVEHSEKLAIHYGVMSVPTVVLLRNGTEVERLIGLRPEQDYITLINRS